MIIRSAQIISFGRWSNQKFVFDDNFQVFFGPNETGKSTLKQFIRGVLFDFDNESDDQINFYEPDSDSEYGGYLNIFANDKEYQISRIGRFDSELQILEIETGKYLRNPQLWLASVLGSVNSELFDQIFSFDQEQLNEITKLSRNELSNRLLRIGVVGSDKWLDLAKKLYNESQKKYGLNSSTRSINSLLSRHDKINKQIESLSNGLTNYQNLQEELNDLEVELKNQNQKIEERNQKINEYSELMKFAPAYSEYINANNQAKKSEDEGSVFNENNSSFLELDQKITALKVQIETINQELVNAAIPETPNASKYVEFDLYNKNEEVLRNLRLELANISNNQLKYEQLTNRYNSLKKVQEKLEKRYDGNVPKPIDDDVRKQLTKNNSQNPRWMVISLYLFSIGSAFSYFRFFDPNDDRKIIAIIFAVLFLLLAGISTYLSRKENSSSDELSDYGYPKKIGVTAALADQESISTYDDNQEQVEEIESDIKDLENEINNQLKFAEPLSEFLGQKITVENISKLVPNINRFFATVDLQHQENASAIATTQIVNNQLINLQTQRNNLAEQLSALYAKVGTNDEESYQQYKIEMNKKQSISQHLEDVSKMISQEDINQIEKYNGPEGIQSLIIETQTEISKIQNIQNSLQQRFSDNQAKLIRMSNDVSYQELVQDRADLETQINAEFENYLTEQLTADWIESTLQQATGDRFPQIVELAKNFFNYLTNGEYIDIILNRENILVENTSGTHYNVVQLSKGTAEQLYVAFRFAFAEIVSNVAQVPIIIDDGFVNFDNQRRQNAFYLLQELAQRHQIIYFTTNQEAVNMFDNVTNLSIINEELF